MEIESRAPISALVRCSPRAAKTSASRAEMPTSRGLSRAATFRLCTSPAPGDREVACLARSVQRAEGLQGELMKGRPLLRAETFEGLLGRLVDDVFARAESSAARRGDGQNAAATVAGVGLAPDQSRPFQLVEELHQVAAVHRDVICELSLRELAVLAEAQEREVRSRGELLAGERVLQPGAGDPAEPCEREGREVQKHRRPRGDFVGCHGCEYTRNTYSGGFPRFLLLRS